MPTCQASLLTIGDELLKGTVLNTNAQFLGRELNDLGFRVKAQVACPDSVSDIVRNLRLLFQASDVLILSGGLGPTPDDLTREGVCAFFRSPLVFSKKQFDFIRRAYRKRGQRVPSLVRKEAMFPANAVPLFNRYGVALGFYIMTQGKLVVVLPGVPSELEKMFQELVKPLLKRNFRNRAKPFSLIVKTAGMGEPEIMKKLGRDFFDDPFDFGIYPESGEVTLRLYAPTLAVRNRLLGKIRKRLYAQVYAFGEGSLAATVGKLLVRNRKTLAVAESCTGGLLAAEITKIPGASRYFQGSITAYKNSVKEKFADVPRRLFSRGGTGAVSREVAAALAEGVQKKMKTTYGLAVTGIAGPGGGTSQKPVGLVYLALAQEKKPVKVWREFLGRERRQIQNRAVKKALQLLWMELR